MSVCPDPAAVLGEMNQMKRDWPHQLGFRGALPCHSTPPPAFNTILWRVWIGDLRGIVAPTPATEAISLSRHQAKSSGKPFPPCRVVAFSPWWNLLFELPHADHRLLAAPRADLRGCASHRGLLWSWRRRRWPGRLVQHPPTQSWRQGCPDCWGGFHAQTQPLS